MNMYAFSGFLLGLTCLLLGILIVRYRSNMIHLTFALQNLSISIWGFGYGFAAISKLPDEAMFWWKFGYIGGFFVIVLLLHHVLLINKISQKKLLIVLYLVAFSIPILAFCNLFGMRMRYTFNSFYFPYFTNHEDLSFLA